MLKSLALLAAIVSLAGCAEADIGATIGPRGGVLFSDDGRLSVEVPPGALTRDAHVSAFASESCEGDTTQQIACYAFEPWGLLLELPASVVFEDPAMAAEDLTLHVEGRDGWGSMPDASHDVNEGEAWGAVMYLTSVSVTQAE